MPFLNPSHAGRLIVLDDYFPNIRSGFRVAEFNAYLQRYHDLRVYSANPDFANVHAEYARLYPHFGDRVLPYEGGALFDASLAYIVFLNNADAFLPSLEIAGLPFVFALYPGGGFGLHDPEIDAKLDRVLASALCRHVIVTQAITMNYLLDRGVARERMSLIFGGVGTFDSKPPERTYFPQKATLDVAFVAYKYMPFGENKGFPEFCRVSSELAGDRAFAWHVIGNFTEADWPPALRKPSALTFHGPMSTSRFREFAIGIDVVVSPNRPFVLHAGNFDGFPTGGCVESSLQGAVMVCSDVLGMNGPYRDGVEIVICPPEAGPITTALVELRNNPERLAAIGRAGQQRSRLEFAPATQLGKRQAVLERFWPAAP
jgi:lipopolysaccharide transport system ATP-binding protein